MSGNELGIYVYEINTELKKQLKKPHQYLWKYYAEDRLLNLLDSSELFFTNVPKFTDNFEGLLPAKARNSFIRWCIDNGSSPTKAAQEAIHYENTRNNFYVSSWHVNDYESYLMWKAYANESRGYAIRTTFERIKTAFNSFSGIINGGGIEYVNYADAHINFGNVFNSVSTKDMPYSDESEFRLFFWKEYQQNKTHPIIEGGIKIPVDLSVLVECVYINPLIDQPSAKVQEALLKHEIKWTSSLIRVQPTYV